MLIKIHKKITEATLKQTDKTLQSMLKNKSILSLMGLQFNLALKIQEQVQTQGQWVLKMLNIPTEKSLSGLYQTVYEIEKNELNYLNKIKDLEEKIEQLESRSIQKKRAGSRIHKEVS